MQACQPSIQASDPLLIDPHLSLYRRTEMALLAKQSFSGTVIDLGGAEIAGYHRLMDGAKQILRVNIDPSYGCDIVADIEKTLPIESNSVDYVVCLNVLEHIFDYHHVVKESCRILKPGGKLCLGTPFLFQVHGSPNDYFRYSDSALRRILSAADFTNVQITPMGHGLLTACYQLAYGLFPKPLQKRLEGLAIFLDSILSRRSRTINPNFFPLGYFTVAEKPDATHSN